MESICESYKVGDIKKAIEVSHTGRALYIRVSCPKCKQERWVPLHRAKKKKYLCQCISCWGKKSMSQCHSKTAIEKRRFTQSGKGNPQWKTGRMIDSQGYPCIWVPMDSPYRQMAKGSHKSHVPEHRLIMAQQLGRCLESWEHVHHIDGIKTHNDIINLQLVNTHQHERHTIEKRLKQELQQVRSILKDQDKQIRLLKWQIKELQKTIQYKIEF